MNMHISVEIYLSKTYVPKIAVITIIPHFALLLHPQSGRLELLHKAMHSDPFAVHYGKKQTKPITLTFSYSVHDWLSHGPMTRSEQQLYIPVTAL